MSSSKSRKRCRQYTTALNAAEITITDLQTRIKEIEASRVLQTNELKKKILEAKISDVKAHIDRYERDSQPYAQLQGVLDRIEGSGRQSRRRSTRSSSLEGSRRCGRQEPDIFLLLDESIHHQGSRGRRRPNRPRDPRR